MKINADLSLRAVAYTQEMAWQSSPAAGVERKMLDRDGEEVARATSLVRFAPGTAFPEHTHGGGEEFLVLEGVFHDGSGAFPEGTYVRNPVGSSHAPSCPDGCVIFVKLQQMSAAEEDVLVVNTAAGTWQAAVDGGPEHQELFVSTQTGETVALERWAASDTVCERVHPSGAEYFVLKGRLSDEEGTYPAGTWLRLPAGARHGLRCQEDALVWLKTGHL